MIVDPTTPPPARSLAGMSCTAGRRSAPGGGWRASRCGKPATCWDGEQPRCAVHSPDAQAARDARGRALYDKQEAAGKARREHIWTRLALADALLEHVALNPDVAPNLPDAIRQKVALAAAAAEEWEARADVVLPERVWGVNWPLVAPKRD